MSPGWITGGNLTEDLGRQGPELAGWPLSKWRRQRFHAAPANAECEASNELI